MRLINLLTYIFANPNLILTKFHMINLLQLLFDFSHEFMNWPEILVMNMQEITVLFFEIIKSWLNYNLHGN